MTPIMVSSPLLLSSFLDCHGLSWTTLASMADTTVADLKNWRRTGTLPLPIWEKFNALNKFFELLRYVAEVEPGVWLETPLPLPAGYHIRPLDCYAPEHTPQLLAMATGDRSIEDVLDELRPNWRHKRSDWQITTAVDGSPSIVVRD